MQGSRYCDFTLSFCLFTDGPETVHLNLWEIFMTERAQCDLGKNHINNISSLSTLLILYLAGRGDGPTLASIGGSYNHC